MTKEIAEIINYMIEVLEIPVLQHRKLPNLIEVGDKLNIIAQPLASQFKTLEGKIQTEDELNKFIKMRELIEKFVSDPSEYFFYELLSKNHLGIIGNNSEIKQEKYQAKILAVKNDNIIPIVFVEILNPLEKGTHVNYTKKPFEKLDVKLNEKLEDLGALSFCDVITQNGEQVRYEVGERYFFSFGGTTQTGKKHVSYMPHQKTLNGRGVLIKVVYRERPKLKFLENLEVKINKIILVENQIHIKAYPVSDKIY